MTHRFREQARSHRESVLVSIQPCTKELGISTLRAIVVRAAAPKNLHQTGKISRK
ncbi:hypothetical protein PG5_59080 [Pseudomonas sp. G5(2012)]|nr:hypothetical protein PG5_59080 [Pseudomonas sp. G5(2012)]